jgi:hypothetical protein
MLFLNRFELTDKEFQYFLPKNCYLVFRNMILRSGIRKKLFRIPDQDLGIKKASDPGSGSATLSLTTEAAVHDAHKGKTPKRTSHYTKGNKLPRPLRPQKPASRQSCGFLHPIQEPGPDLSQEAGRLGQMAEQHGLN